MNKTIEELYGSPPIIIFGTGGSGTRVFAQLVNAAGCFLGSNLNAALDNQDFAFYLAGRIRWMERHFPFPYAHAKLYLSLFHQVYFQKSLSIKDILVTARIALTYLIGRNRVLFSSRPIQERIRNAKNLVGGTPDTFTGESVEYRRWGFKSPPAIYFIQPLKEYFRGAQFIHVIRDGRDVATSNNQKPLLYRKILNGFENDPILNSYRNWQRINQWAIQYGRKHLPANQYLRLKYEDICTKPKATIDQLISFTQLKTEKAEALYAIPHKNPAIGRWKQHAERFKHMNMSFLQELGYQ
jgi:hypothetical protein